MEIKLEFGFHIYLLLIQSSFDGRMSGKLHEKSGQVVYGAIIDDDTRCEHYHSELDIISIKFKCCLRFYPWYASNLRTYQFYFMILQ